ncbi:hypothetical protein AMTR_s00039p00149410 [Amborella trichopoda]|uniref:Uncharacterized protein n=1 Tax=Amborella trichopoda TaxID=13333 RepID=U5D059_AMBTC|nr:hypothetical protein AMTR_s00039p00149410 [Amborella trichopoda]
MELSSAFPLLTNPISTSLLPFLPLVLIHLCPTSLPSLPSKKLCAPYSFKGPSSRHHSRHPKLVPSSLAQPPPLSPSHHPFVTLVIPVEGSHSASLEQVLQLSLVGHFYPKRNDVKGIQRRVSEAWNAPDLSCRNLSSDDILFSFPSEASLLKALGDQDCRFEGVALILCRWTKKWVLLNPRKSDAECLTFPSKPGTSTPLRGLETPTELSFLSNGDPLGPCLWAPFSFWFKPHSSLIVPLSSGWGTTISRLLDYNLRTTTLDSMLHHDWTSVSRKLPSWSNRLRRPQNRRANQNPQTHPKPRSCDLDHTAQLAPPPHACANIQAHPQPMLTCASLYLCSCIRRVRRRYTKFPTSPLP